MSRLRHLTPAAPDGPDQLIVLPGARIEEADWEAVAAWLAQWPEHQLILADPRRTYPPWLELGSPREDQSGTAPLVPGGQYAESLADSRLVLPGASTLTELPAVAHPLLLRGDRPYAALYRYGEGTVIALADDRLFTNGALVAGDNARFLTYLLSDMGHRVAFVGRMNGVAAATPWESIQRGKMAPLMLQAMLFCLVLFWARGAAFGRGRPLPEAPRRRFEEHVRALGLHYSRAEATPLALATWGRHMLERLREKTGVHRRQGLAGLAERVAELTGEPVGRVMALFVAVKEAEDPATWGASRKERARARRDALANMKQLDALWERLGG